MTAQQAVEKLLRPQSVVVVGASSNKNKIAGKIVPNLLANDFSGKIYQINPKADEINGLPVYKSVKDLPETPDLAYVILPSDLSVKAIRECGEKGIPVAISSAAGFSENEDEMGQKRSRALEQIVEETGIRIVGPNTNGIYNATDGISVGFNATHARKLEAGGFGIIAHSGAMFNVFANRARNYGLGISKFISCGNQVDLELLDFLEYYANDEVTSVIGLMVDAISDGVKFAELVKLAQGRGKKVLALKMGEYPPGAFSAHAHASRESGDYQAYAELFAACGVSLVHSIEAFMAAAALLSQGVDLPAGTGMGAITVSGGAGALAADAAARKGVSVPEFSQVTIDKFKPEHLFSIIGNPLDMGVFGGMVFPSEVLLATVAAEEKMGVVVFIVHEAYTEIHDDYSVALAESQKLSGKLHIVLCSGGLEDAEEQKYRDEGVLIFREMETLMDALAATLSEDKCTDDMEVIKAIAGRMHP